jgi:hypothetical protein
MLERQLKLMPHDPKRITRLVQAVTSDAHDQAIPVGSCIPGVKVMPGPRNHVA